MQAYINQDFSNILPHQLPANFLPLWSLRPIPTDFNNSFTVTFRDKLWKLLKQKLSSHLKSFNYTSLLVIIQLINGAIFFIYSKYLTEMLRSHPLQQQVFKCVLSMHNALSCACIVSTDASMMHCSIPCKMFMCCHKTSHWNDVSSTKKN